MPSINGTLEDWSSFKRSGLSFEVSFFSKNRSVSYIFTVFPNRVAHRARARSSRDSECSDMVSAIETNHLRFSFLNKN